MAVRAAAAVATCCMSCEPCCTTATDAACRCIAMRTVAAYTRCCLAVRYMVLRHSRCSCMGPLLPLLLPSCAAWLCALLLAPPAAAWACARMLLLSPPLLHGPACAAASATLLPPAAVWLCALLCDCSLRVAHPGDGQEAVGQQGWPARCTQYAATECWVLPAAAAAARGVVAGAHTVSSTQHLHSV